MRALTLPARHTAAAHRRSSRWSLLTLLPVYRSRKALAELDDHMLRDIGLTRAEAEAEAARPAWDVPATWRR